MGFRETVNGSTVSRKLFLLHSESQLEEWFHLIFGICLLAFRSFFGDGGTGFSITISAEITYDLE